MITQEHFVEAVVEKILTDKHLYALMLVEDKKEEFKATKLEAAEKALNQVNQQIAFWNHQRELATASMHEIRGALAGCDTLIVDELNKFGVTRETYERQKADYLAEKEQEEKTSEDKE